MAGIAGQSGGVVGGSDLRETFRLGRVRFVALYTEHRRVELGRLHRGRIVGMLGERAVAGLTIDVRVLAVLFLVEDVGMAGLTSLMAREVDGAGSDLGHRGPAVVPVLSKTFWNQESADDQEQEDARDKYRGQSEKVSGIFESLHSGAGASVAAGPRLLAAGPPFAVT